MKKINIIPHVAWAKALS